MILTNRTKYGMRAMFYLARQYNEGPQLLTDIANEEVISAKFLATILLELKKGGVINSKMGKGGGYYLSRNPSKISIAEILRILDGPFAPTPCLNDLDNDACEDCRNVKTCLVRKVMYQVHLKTYTYLSKTSLKDAIHLKIP
jgi:Rrf2 family protein